MNFELLLATVSFTFGHIIIPHTCTTYQFFSFDKILRRTCHVYLPGRYTYVNRISALSVVLVDLLKKKKKLKIIFLIFTILPVYIYLFIYYKSTLFIWYRQYAYTLRGDLASQTINKHVPVSFSLHN